MLRVAVATAVGRGRTHILHNLRFSTICGTKSGVGCGTPFWLRTQGVSFAQRWRATNLNATYAGCDVSLP
eukprot:4670149-Lingulodinium_polyedra.AAC.1